MLLYWIIGAIQAIIFQYLITFKSQIVTIATEIKWVKGTKWPFDANLEGELNNAQLMLNINQFGIIRGVLHRGPMLSQSHIPQQTSCHMHTHTVHTNLKKLMLVYVDTNTHFNLVETKYPGYSLSSHISSRTCILFLSTWCFAFNPLLSSSSCFICILSALSRY